MGESTNVSIWVPVIVAVVAATPGVLVWWNGRTKTTSEERRADKAQHTADVQTAIDGFAELVGALREQLDREKDECTARIKQAEEDCKRVIDRVAGRLNRRINELKRELEARTDGGS